MKGIIIQPGAFNPVHRRHFEIADNAKKRFPTYFHGFILSEDTCDKGVIPRDELMRRRKPIVDAGYNAFITKSGLFVDHISLLREQFEEKFDLQIVIACGEDTLHRFFRDWEKFHENSIFNNCAVYEARFQNVKWYVTKRPSDKLEYQSLVDKYLTHYNNVIWSDLPPDDISSTKIREKQSK